MATSSLPFICLLWNESSMVLIKLLKMFITYDTNKLKTIILKIKNYRMITIFLPQIAHSYQQMLIILQQIFQITNETFTKEFTT
jgi:hypothetical protein